MKKYIAVLLTLTLMLGLGAVTVQAAGNYPSTDADFGVTIDILEDGSVNIGANADAINSAVSSVASGFNANWIYIAIYDSNPNFNADSDMTGAGQPYTEVLAGDTTAGRVDGSAFKYNIKSGTLDKDDPTYPFEEGKTYYVYICACDGANWVWNYAGTSFTYKTKGNYPSYKGDWGVTAEVQEDGSVIINADKAKIDASAEGINALGTLYVTVYDADPNFNMGSDMTGSGNEPYGKAQAGPNNVGKLDDFSYKITKGEDGNGTGSYPFEEGHTYYVYVCPQIENKAPLSTDWIWNYEGISFVYSTEGGSATATATATGTATATTTATATATTEVTATATATAAATGTQSTDDPNHGGDLSVLLYAAAALAAGGGALALRKKK